MEPMIVRNQTEYENAERAYQKILDEEYFDLDAGKGNEIIEEVDYLLYNYHAHTLGGTETETALSRYYFTPSQAKEILEYFDEQRVRDLYDIEKGLNALNLSTIRELNLKGSLIEIRDPDETITVSYPVSVYGSSVVEATGFAVVSAYDEARILAHNDARVFAFNKVKATAYQNALVTVYHQASCDYNGSSVGIGNNRAVLAGYDNSRITLFGKSTGILWNKAKMTSFNESSVTAHEESLVEAYDKSLVQASNTVSIEANDHAVIVAEDNVHIKAKGRALILTKGNDVICRLSENARKIDSEIHKLAYLEKNVLEIMEHPGIGRNPFKAVNILLKAVPEGEKERFSEELQKLGCRDKESTDTYFSSLKTKDTYFRSLRKDTEYSWER